MIINAHDDDKLPIDIRGNSLGCCDEYVYLGAVFTSDGSLKSSIAKHGEDQEKHLHKLIMFLNTNRYFPFYVKRKVVEAAFNFAIFYGCEYWIGGNCHEVEKLYICAIKYLLGVRKSTANDLCLIELGMLPLPAVVKQRQYNFQYKVISKVIMGKTFEENLESMAKMSSEYKASAIQFGYIASWANKKQFSYGANPKHQHTNNSDPYSFLSYRDRAKFPHQKHLGILL